MRKLEIKLYCLFLIFLFVTVSCTKVEDGVVVPEALPYSLTTEDNVYAKGFNFSIAMTYDSLFESDHLEWLKFCVDSSLYRNYVKAKCNFFLGMPCIDDEITFNNIKYKDVKYIEFFSKKVDGNNNGSLDEVFLLEYPDSIVLQMHDHKVSSNIPYFSHSFLREDNHILNSVALWNHPVDSTQYIVLLKSNRLIWSKAKTCDTLIYLDIKTKKIRSTPIGASIPSNDNLYISNDSLLILIAVYPRNYHPEYLGFDDCHSYVIAYKSDGSILWADTTSNSSENTGTSFLRTSSNNTTAFILSDYKLNKHKLKMIDNHTGKYLKEVDCENLIPYTFNKVDKRNEVIFFKDNKLIAYDTSLHLIRTKEFPFGFYLHWHKIGMITNYFNYKEKEPKIDLNSNGANDFLMTNIKNQLLLIDGKTFDILFATPPFSTEIHFGIVRKKNSPPNLVIVSDDYFYRFTFSKTSLFVIFNAYIKDFINYFLILLLLIIIIFSYYKIYYFSFLFKLLNSKSKTQGVIIFSSVYNKQGTKLEKKLKSINDKSIEILSLEKLKKKEISENLPIQIINIVNSTFNKKENLTLDLTIETNQEPKYLEIKTYYFSIFIKNYCIVIITDLTARIKSEILTTSITIAHDAKNQLATIQQNILNLFNVLEENYGIQQDSINKRKQKIIKKINDSSTTIMKLLFAANVPNFYKSTINFSSFIDEWIEDKILRYQYEDITFINNIDKNLPLIEVSENQISFLLQCACDNADQAIPKDQKERIIEFSSHLNNQYLEIGIKDNGIGISEEILNSINTNHFTTKATGTGLGLKIIKSVVEKHNALLSIQSKLHNGTQLLIKFPINERI